MAPSADSAARATRGRVIALFDGAERGRLADRYGALEIVWSGAGRSADDEIVRRVESAAARGRSRDWIVVTNDRELVRRCRDAGARVESAAAFAERIDRPAAPSKRRGRKGDAGAADKPAANAEEREHWRNVFGSEE